MSTDIPDIDGLDLDALTDERTNGHGESGGEAGDELAVDGDDVRDKRIKEILSRKQEAVDMRQKARLAMSNRGTSHGAAASAYRAVLESFITAVQPLLHEGDGPHYWSEKQYATMHLSPPGHRDTGGIRDKWVLPDGTTLPYRPDGQQIEIVGLKALFDYSDPIERAIEVDVERGCYGTVQETHVTKEQFGFGILDDMLVDLNNHIADVGIGIGTESDDRWSV